MAPPRRDEAPDQAGFSLVEMMVATALLGLLFTAVLGVMASALKVSATSESNTLNVGEVQNAMDVVTRDIRSAVAANGTNAITAASATSMTMTTNLGSSAGTTQVTFTLAGTKLTEYDYVLPTPTSTTYPATPTRTVVLTSNLNLQGATLFTYYISGGTTLANPVPSASLSTIENVVVDMVDDGGRRTGQNFSSAGQASSYSAVLVQRVFLRDVTYAGG